MNLYGMHQLNLRCVVPAGPDCRWRCGGRGGLSRRGGPEEGGGGCRLNCMPKHRADMCAAARAELPTVVMWEWQQRQGTEAQQITTKCTCLGLPFHDGAAALQVCDLCKGTGGAACFGCGGGGAMNQLISRGEREERVGPCLAVQARCAAPSCWQMEGLRSSGHQ